MESLYGAIKQTLGPLGRDILLSKAAVLTNQGSIIIDNVEESSHLVQVVKKTLKHLVDGKSQFVILSYLFIKAIETERRNKTVQMIEKLYFSCFDRVIIEPFIKISKRDENAAEMLAWTALYGKYTREKTIEIIKIAENAANHDFSYRNLEFTYEILEAIYVGDAIKLVKGNIIRGQISKIFSGNRLNPKIIIIPSRDLIPVSIETDISNLLEYSLNLQQELLLYLQENNFSVAILDSSAPLWVKDSFCSLKTTVLEVQLK
ncbi:unnamed protein product [Blepharisma stoltei]|uniref:Uncharacterized protein n=1 Tax=Blepharisma stoltei TaxID=1481888 RepID=A0AAU9KAQ0_9CILI|nr:unnamed protein product [Blepharisma stoltei]